jgi:hypothetical protein
VGCRSYPEAKELLVLCDNGGCNGSKNRLWKYELQEFADHFGIAVHVAHYPPRASKWNPIEHRLFSFISKNWAGQPLTSYEKMLNYIRTTKTQSGLKVRASLLEKHFPTRPESKSPTSKWMRSTCEGAACSQAGTTPFARARIEDVIFGQPLIRLVLISTSVLVAGLTHTLTPLG